MDFDQLHNAVCHTYFPRENIACTHCKLFYVVHVKNKNVTERKERIELIFSFFIFLKLIYMQKCILNQKMTPVI